MLWDKATFDAMRTVRGLLVLCIGCDARLSYHPPRGCTTETDTRHGVCTTCQNRAGIGLAHKG